jgi:pilus assembly protein Flp/PilA
MLKLSVKAQNFIQDESGQDLVEYSLLGALIAVACVTTMSGLATAITTEFGLITAKL